jgi:hypothetical protein
MVEPPDDDFRLPPQWQIRCHVLPDDAILVLHPDADAVDRGLQRAPISETDSRSFE